MGKKNKTSKDLRPIEAHTSPNHAITISIDNISRVDELFSRIESYVDVS